jgi:hypothetical protein
VPGPYPPEFKREAVDLSLLREVHPEGDQRAKHPAARISPPAPRYPLKEP